MIRSCNISRFRKESYSTVGLLEAGFCRLLCHFTNCHFGLAGGRVEQDFNHVIWQTVATALLEHYHFRNLRVKWDFYSVSKHIPSLPRQGQRYDGILMK